MNWRILKGLCVLILGSVSSLAQPVIQSLSPSGDLVWTNPVPGSFSTIERATNISGPWLPFFYEVATNGTLTTRLPTNASSQSFYRIKVHTNAPDPSLVMHLPFENEFASGTVVDISGHRNHGLRYGKPGTPTNWPSLTLGPDGSQAAEFHSYYDGYGLYGRSGDYIAIPITTNLTPLPQATISIWASYYTSLGNEIANDHNSTLMNSGKDFPGTFFFGRNYANYTSFTVVNSLSSAQEAIVFPDASPIGNSGGWHHYVITFDGGVVKGYFDGELIGTSVVSPAALTAAGHYIGMSCWTFNVTPELDLNVDGHPNNAWINGAVDDARIYRRVLSAGEVEDLYQSFDTLPPTVPGNLLVEASASSLVTLHWNPSTDLYGVQNYIISRNGAVIGETTNTVFFDSGLDPDTFYSYTIQARDIGGRLSAPSVGATVTTRAINGGVDLIVDDADGSPWVQPAGHWSVGFANATVLTGIYRASFVGDDRVDKGKTYTFFPPIPESGSYSVFIWHPGKADATHLFSPAVPVDVVSGVTTNTVFVNQRTGIGQWKLLGVFPLSEGAYVRVRTDGTSTSHYVLGDAIRLTR